MQVYTLNDIMELQDLFLKCPKEYATCGPEGYDPADRCMTTCAKKDDLDLQELMVPPAWLTTGGEKPAGSADMGSWTKAEFTKEQQGRLGVDKHGQNLKVLLII